MASETTPLHSVREWIAAVNDPAGRFHDALVTICARDESQRAQAARMCVRALEAFGDAHGLERETLLIRSAGRVNILGTHIDHRGGSVNPVAINHLWLVASPRADDLVVARNVESGQFPDEQFRICDCLPAGARIADWDAWCHTEYDKRKGNRLDHVVELHPRRGPVSAARPHG